MSNVVSIPGLQLVIPGGDWTFPPDLPDDGAKLWRYIDLAKLASLLQSGALCLPRADMLGDPYEGGWSNAARETFQEYASEDYVDTALGIHRMIRKRSWVSCWHESDRESEALWRLYSRDNQGIAIQTTIDKLTAVVSPVSSFAISDADDDGVRHAELSGVSRVHYLDYSTHGPHLNNTLGPLICKRAAFAHEREVRAIIQSLALGEKKVRVVAVDGAPFVLKDIALNHFLEAILVDPLAPDWFLSIVEGLVAKYGVDVQVRRSCLQSTPEL